MKHFKKLFSMIGAALVIVLPLSIDFAKAADDRDKWAYNSNNARPSYNYDSYTSAYSGYNSMYSSNPGTQAPLTEKEIEFKKLEEAFCTRFRETFYIPFSSKELSLDEKIEMIKGATELKEWESIYREKFHAPFYRYDDKASPDQKIDMIKKEIKLKEAEDSYSKKFRTEFRFSECAINSSYSILSTDKKLKIITEEMEFKDLLRSYAEEFQGRPHISDVVTLKTADLKAAQIEALKGEIEIQRLIRSLKSAHPAITDEELASRYSQLPVAENGIPTRLAIISALQAEQQRRERS